jgi:uncharacterized damage-inducible protein DinB
VGKSKEFCAVPSGIGACEVEMKRIALKIFCLAFVLLLSTGTALAQAAAADRDEVVRNFSDAADKAVRLAEAMPAEKFTWRPMEGVRSVSEVFLHIAAANFSISRRFGATVPAGIQLNAEFEKQSTDKAKVVEILKQSVEHVKQAMNNLQDADLTKTSPWFGGKQATHREIMFFLASHTHEHLGQSIAYARMNHVTPPWTEEAQQRPQQAPAKKQP